MTDNTNNHIVEIERGQEGVIGNLATLHDINIQEKLINMLKQAFKPKKQNC